MDTSCAALMRLAQAVHAQGYKVALTGEGADEALAGYVWFKTQTIRDKIRKRIGHGLPMLLASSCSPRSAAVRDIGPLAGDRRCSARPARHVRVDLARPGRSFTRPNVAAARRPQPLRRPRHHQCDRIKRWHPLNQSLYVGYKVMLAGLLMISKGDRIAMHASVESRYPFLDDDVI